jgi:hypothetical protein
VVAAQKLIFVKLAVSGRPIARSGRKSRVGRVRTAPVRGCCEVRSAGPNAWGRDVTEVERREASIEALHRMITYLREEAVRLRVMDVAVLLEHAEDVVTVFAPATLNRPCRGPAALDASRVEH